MLSLASDPEFKAFFLEGPRRGVRAPRSCQFQRQEKFFLFRATTETSKHPRVSSASAGDPSYVAPSGRGSIWHPKILLVSSARGIAVLPPSRGADRGANVRSARRSPFLDVRSADAEHICRGPGEATIWSGRHALLSRSASSTRIR